MKKIYLNLKRFDIPVDLGGINNIGFGEKWARTIVSCINEMKDLEYTVFLPESSLLSALKVARHVNIGCEGVYHKDVSKGGNFGAFTTYRTAKSMKAIGVNTVLIGHCEERNGKSEMCNYFGGKGDVNEILNKEIKCALDAGLDVLYCIGEKAEEQEHKYDVLEHQLNVGLKDVDLKKITIAYEPVWAIGPGKTPPDKAYIEDIAKFIKSVKNVPVVYGGGLKIENAKMIASIKELDGGLIALTRFGKDFGFSTEDFKEIVKTYKEEINL